MAGQDIKKLLPPGGGMPVQVSGDYIYLKFADRPIDVIINGGRSGQTRVNMEAGDKYRPGAFEGFEIQNPDPDNPAQVVFTVGEGDYNRQIVQGEITVTPGIRQASGEFVEDTRRDIEFSVFLRNNDLNAVSYGDVLYETQKGTGVPGQRFENLVGVDFDGELFSGYVFTGYGGTNDFVRLFYDTEYNEVSRIAYTTNASAGGLAESNRVPQGMANIGPAYMAVKDNFSTYKLYFGTLHGGDNIATKVQTIPEKNTAHYGRLENGFVHIAKVGSGSTYQVRKFDVAGNKTDDYTITSIGPSDGAYKFLEKFAFDQSSGKLFAMLYNSSEKITAFAEVNTDTFRQAEPPRYFSYPASFRLLQTFGIYADRAMVTTNYFDSSNPTAVVFALADYVELPEIEVIGGDCNTVGQLLYASTEDVYRSRAEVSLNGDKASGQIIKALLESYFNAPVADNYMDSVFRFEYAQIAGGARRAGINTGSITFARAKVVDDFDVKLPNIIGLSVDNTLTFK